MLNLLCVVPSTQLSLTSTVGQPIHGIAFVAQTLKTTRGVHTGVITCALEEAFVYICNQNQADDIIAGQSVGISHLMTTIFLLSEVRQVHYTTAD